MLDFIEGYEAFPRELTTAMIADRLGVTVQTVRQYVKDGRLEAYRIGKKYIVPKEALLRFLEMSKTRPKECGSPDEKQQNI